MTQPEDLTLTDDLSGKERPFDAPDADAHEQSIVADPSLDQATPSRALEVSEWDAQEQSYVVPMDDDYR